MGVLEIAFLIFLAIVVISFAIGFYIHNKNEEK